MTKPNRNISENLIRFLERLPEEEREAFYKKRNIEVRKALEPETYSIPWRCLWQNMTLNPTHSSKLKAKDGSSLSYHG